MSNQGVRTTVNGTQEYLTGDLIGTLRVGLIENRHPLRWHAKCNVCGASSVYDHQYLTRGSARCKNPQCNVSRERAGQATAPTTEPDWEALAENPKALEYFKTQAAIAKERQGRK